MTASRRLLRGLLILLLALLPASARPDVLSPAEINNGWLNLYDGSLFGWNASGAWQSQPSILTAASGADRKLMYALPVSDFELRFMFRITQKQTGAAFRLRTNAEGSPADSGFRIPLADGDASWPSGSIVHKAKSTVSLSVGQWHMVAIEAGEGRITVKMDGQQTASTADGGIKSGYFGFESKKDSELELRDIHLLPKNMEKIFNGGDLSGWKNVPFEKPAGGGVFHPVEKIFGAGGGGKPHSAKWTVGGGKIQGEKGPGALETTAPYQDFVLQITAAAQTKKKESFPAFYIRNDAGKMFTGYAVGIGPKTGQIQGLGQPRRAITPRNEATQTIIAANRQIGVFVDGVLVTLATDTRPEGTTGVQGARITGGVISLGDVDDGETVSFRNIALQPIAKPFGGMVRAEIVAPPPVVQAVTPPPPPPPDMTAQTKEIAAALGVMDPKQKAKVASLMSSAVRSNDPQQQKNLYTQIIELDPSNVAAVQGYKDAQTKQEAQQKAQAEDLQKQQTQQVTQDTTQTQLTSARASAQSAFLAGHLKEADRDLALAERFGPGDPITRDLRSRISAAYSLRSRLMYLGSAAGLATVAGMFWMWRRRRHQAKNPVLEMTKGLEQGRTFPVDKDLTRIGAVRQDGGQKNDIMVEDIEHMISRFHCELQRKDGNFFLVDLGSSNGTRVDGKKAAPRIPIPIKKGSRIDLAGTVELRFGYDRKPRS